MKKWAKLIIFCIIVCVISAYAYFHFQEEKPNVIETSQQIDLPIGEIFPYFDNLQKLNGWIPFFQSEKYPSVEYYFPYEGKDAAATFSHKKEGKQLEISIKNSKKPYKIRYQILDPNEPKPIILDVNFSPINPKNTKILWKVMLPSNSFSLSENIFDNEENFKQKIEVGSAQLKNLIQNKIQRENQLGKIQFDSIEIENIPDMQYIGVTSSIKNQSEKWLKNIQMNNDKLENFIAIELGLKPENYGYPTIFFSSKNTMKEASYFLGIPVNKVPNITDASFSIQRKPATKAFVGYYRGEWSGRQKIINSLLQKSVKEQVQTAGMSIIFLEKPKENHPVLIKIVLPFS